MLARAVATATSVATTISTFAATSITCVLLLVRHEHFQWLGRRRRLLPVHSQEWRDTLRQHRALKWT